MKKILNYITSYASPELTQKALLFMRICVGLFMVTSGLLKFIGGTPTFQFLGSTMANFGIHFMPIMWGFLAACAEFFGGFGLALGLATRFASALLCCVMIVAVMFHLHNGDPISIVGFPLMMLVVFLSFSVMGTGKYSVDAYLRKKL